MERALRGTCSCGRNRYVIEVPRSSSHLAQVVFDNSNAHRRIQAAPFCAWLIVPLTWYTSATYAYFPDESHTSIRRTFSASRPTAAARDGDDDDDIVETSSRRQFCGYCGTPLSYWHEHTREDADRISVTLGSLLDEDLEKLERLGLLRIGADDEEQEQIQVAPPVRSVLHRGAPWFEDLVEDSLLGKIKRQRGGHVSRDVAVEWEIVEWTDEQDDEDATLTTPGKRKLGEMVDGPGDVQMGS